MNLMNFMNILKVKFRKKFNSIQDFFLKLQPKKGGQTSSVHLFKETGGTRYKINW